MTALSHSPRFSLRIKAIAAIILLLLMFFAAFLFYTVEGHHLLVERLMQRCYASYVTMLATTLNHVIRENRTDLIAHYLEHPCEDPAIQYVTLERSSGERIYYAGTRDVQADPKIPERKGSRQEAQEGHQSMQHGHDVREIGSPSGFFHTSGHLFEITNPVQLSDSTMGILRLGLSTAQMNQAVASITYGTIQLIILASLFGGFLVLLIDRRIKHILHGLITTTQDMASGDLTKRVTIQTGDALEKLGTSFNTMAQILQDREHELRQHRDHLGVMVANRTGELEQERSRLQAILNHVPSALIFLDPERKIQAVSSAFKPIMGRSETDIIGHSCCAEICRAHFNERCLPAESIEQESLQTGTFHFQEDGNEKTVELMALPIKDDQHLIGILQIITDVTEQRRLQERLIRAEKLAATGELAAVVAHEFRNTLSSVRVLLQLLHESAEEGTESKETLTTVLEALSRMERLVNDLLKFARPAPLELTSLDLNEILESSITMILPRIRETNINIKHSFHRLPLLSGDASQLREVFINLLLNAVQAISSSGCITIESLVLQLQEDISDDFAEIPTNAAATLAFQLHSIRFRRGEKIILVTIRDDGVGISKTDLDRIFEPFYTSKPQGAGLGLAMVKRVVNAHGGIIRVASESLVGTTFSLFLPLNH